MVIEELHGKVGAINWLFPLPRTHTGIAMANGVQGLLVWGDETLVITVGRSGFWDHQGGNDFSNRITFLELKELLVQGNEEEVTRRFSIPATGSQSSICPQQLGCGRLEFFFPRGLRPIKARLELESGSLNVQLGNEVTGEQSNIVIHQSISQEVAWLEIPSDLRGQIEVVVSPAWRFLSDTLCEMGFEAPTLLDDGFPNLGGGFSQRTPEDLALALVWSDRNSMIVFATELSTDPMTRARSNALESDPNALVVENRIWWTAYWNTVPSLHIPDDDLMRMHTYGLFKLGGLTTPHGIAATLQGPWMEDYQIPLWSNDYHFNINLELIYWPLLSSNMSAHFDPLWDMVISWLPKLTRYASQFFGASDALMLPHAVDDRCQVVGEFWHGTIDHASTAWMAQLAWLHYRYSGDKSVLVRVAWPLLTGAFNGFWSMLDQREDEFVLPVSVSPEYGEGAPGSWGSNSSFQLAALHCVAEILPQCAAAMNMPIDPRWHQISSFLPKCSTLLVEKTSWDSPGSPDKFRIAIWEGQDLEFSHRHHSHLAGIYPFDILDRHNPAEVSLINESLEHWRVKGAGAWCAWCLPWASMICSRAERIDAGVAWLKWLIDTHENEGGSLAAGGHRGAIASWGSADEARGQKNGNEVMQLDANIGIVTAIHELLVRCTRGKIEVLTTVPWNWRNFSFDGILAVGGFLIGATVHEGNIREIRVSSLRGENLNLIHGINCDWSIGNEVIQRQGNLDCTTSVGQKLTIKPVVCC